MQTAQQGQVFLLAGRDRDATNWAYRYRLGGRGSKRVGRGGFESEGAAAEALERVPKLLDTYQAAQALDLHQVGAPWTPEQPFEHHPHQQTSG